MMVRLMRRHELVCQQVVELVTDYLEGALSRGERKRFERHLRACPNCTAYVEQLHVTIALSGQLTPDDVPPQAMTELTELYRSWRDEDPEGTG